MTREQLADLIKGYDRPIQQVIVQVMKLEQEYIDQPRPRVKDQIERIIQTVAAQSGPLSKDQQDEA